MLCRLTQTLRYLGSLIPENLHIERWLPLIAIAVSLGRCRTADLSGTIYTKVRLYKQSFDSGYMSLAVQVAHLIRLIEAENSKIFSSFYERSGYIFKKITVTL